MRDADVDPFAYFDPTLAMVAAQQAIPRNATYTIVVGDERSRDGAGASRSTSTGCGSLPRRYTTDIHKAQWALTYFKSSESSACPYTNEIGLGPGVNAVEARAGRSSDEDRPRAVRRSTRCTWRVGYALLYATGSCGHGSATSASSGSPSSPAGR